MLEGQSYRVWFVSVLFNSGGEPGWLQLSREGGQDPLNLLAGGCPAPAVLRSWWCAAVGRLILLSLLQSLRSAAQRKGWKGLADPIRMHFPIVQWIPPFNFQYK